MHFDEGLSARYKGGDSTKLVTKGVRGKSASEKLTEEGLVKFSARVSIQVIRFYYTEKISWILKVNT
jgi:zinc finger FYVE domain-containing protein 26